jgi:hypothetical protein
VIRACNVSIEHIFALVKKEKWKLILHAELTSEILEFNFSFNEKNRNSNDRCKI